MASVAADDFNKGIADFYDASADICESEWGDHLHCGYYDPLDSASPYDHDYHTAHVRMIEEALRFAGVPDDAAKKPKTIVDVGCGMGGTAKYLAKKYGAQCKGINLSPVQVERAQAHAIAEGLADKVSFLVADGMDQPFPDGQFDLVWSMECAEYMPDKTKFLGELARVAAPGATIVVAAMFHRNLSPSEVSLNPAETKLLSNIRKAHHHATWCSPSDFVEIAKSLSLEDIKTADWSANVAPYWRIVIRSSLTWRGIMSLLGSGWNNIKGALAVPMIAEGYDKKLIKYTIITCRKPLE